MVCGRPEVDLHHLDYARLGGEEYGDLIAVCRAHHDRIHAAWDATPHLRKLGRRAASIAVITTMRQHAGSRGARSPMTETRWPNRLR